MSQLTIRAVGASPEHVTLPERTNRDHNGTWMRRTVLQTAGGDALTLDIEGSGTAPAWLSVVVHEFDEILRLPESWDSYRARPVDRAAAVAALELLAAVMHVDTPPPIVVPTNRGGVQLEWHQQGIDLEVEVHSDGRVHVFCEDLVHHTEWEKDLDVDRTALESSLEQLVARA